MNAKKQSGGSLDNDLGDGKLVSPKKSVGNMTVTSRGYNGGTEMSELIGAKKMESPEGAK
jgi:hypothetical protein